MSGTPDIKPGDRVEIREGLDVILGEALTNVTRSEEQTYRLPDGWVTVPQKSSWVKVKADDGRTLFAPASTVVRP